MTTSTKNTSTKAKAPKAPPKPKEPTGYFEDVQEAIDRATKGHKDYSVILPFMVEPIPTKYRRTAPEIAYRKMGDALEGMEPCELRELARFIPMWRKCDRYARWVTWRVMVNFINEQERREQERKYQDWLDRYHPVISFSRMKRAKRALNS